MYEYRLIVGFYAMPEYNDFTGQNSLKEMVTLL